MDSKIDRTDYRDEYFRMKNFLAANPFGSIPAPETAISGNDPGLVFGKILNLVLQMLIVGAGIYALINLVLAGYAFLGAGGDDPKKIEAAWAKIWQTLLGLAFAAGAFVLAAIFGQLIFGRWDFIVNPVIPTLQ